LAHTSFVGRERELAQLNAALGDAISRQGRLVMLVGEPGIGKTRTAEELAGLARQRGAVVLWGRCPEERGAPPYWPWAQIIRSYVGEREPGVLRSEMGAGAADIAQVVPEVREGLPDLPASPVLQDPEQARFRLFDSITSFLKRASQKQPLVLTLDNLHWADPSSLRLLEFLAQEVSEARVLVIGTYRDVDVSRGHPLFRTLGELTRQRLYQRVLLRGLSQGEVGQVMGTVGGIAPPQELVATVHQQTEGNPLFVGEVVRLLAQEGMLAAERLVDLKSWDFRLPEGIREVIGRRLDQLSGRCNELLAIASVVGREFSIGLLERLGQQPEAALLEVLEEALVARIIEELPHPVGHYQFTHALIQQTLAAELSTTRKVRLHARIAEALEELYGAAAEAHAAELAHHFAEASPITGPEKLVRYSLLAGERALAAYAWEEALGHFHRGLAAREVPPTGTVPAPDAETAALLFGLGRSQLATLERAQSEGAVANLQRAFDYYAVAGDVAGALAVAQYPIVALGTGRTGVAGFIPRALKLAPPDSLAAGRLLCSYGGELGRLEGDYENAHAAFAQALAIARREGDLALEVRTLAVAANVDYFHLRSQEGLEQARRAIALAGRLADQAACWSPHVEAARILTFTAEVGGAQQHAAAALELAERLRGRYQLAQSFWMNTMLLRLQGGWQGARQFSDRGLAVSPQDVLLLGERVLLEYEVGDFGQGEAYLERFLASIPPAAARPSSDYALPAAIIPCVARITGALDRLDIAATAAQAVVSSPFANPLFAMQARAGLGLLAVLRGDVALAGKQYGALEARRGTMVPGGPSATDRLLGLLAHSLGDLGKAAEHFEDALAFCRKAGCRPELAWACHDYADMLLSRKGLGDAHKAMSLLDQALAITQELGMPPLMGRVVALHEKAKSQPEKAPAYPDGLTQREVEVLCLIAAGKTDREIAEELIISVRTVGNHVGNILNKTNTANRTEAATYAAHHGLV
jgi:DNA-binding CsgD family transcriptional regulator